MPHTPIGRKKPERVIAGWLVVIGIVIAVVAGVGYARYQYDKAKKKAEVEQAETARKAAEYARTHPATTATILRFDGFTPCDPPINFAFELDTQGDPISLKFPGISTPLEYSGKGTLNAPEQRTSGPVRITSLDSQKQARVRIWEVVIVPGR